MASVEHVPRDCMLPPHKSWQYSLLAPRRAAVHGNGASEQPPRCLPLRSQFQLRNARAFFRCFASCSGLFLYPASHSSPAQIDDINLPCIACYKHIAGRATSRYRKSESLALRQVCVAAVRPAPVAVGCAVLHLCLRRSYDADRRGW